MRKFFQFGIFAPIFFSLVLLVCGPLLGIDNFRYPMLLSVLSYLSLSYLQKNWLWRDRLEQIFSHRLFPWLLALAAGIVFFQIKLMEWRDAGISGIDFSHIDYAIWSTRHGHFMEIPFLAPQKTFLDFFGNHFSPILFIFVAIRYLWDSPISALFVHAFALAAAIPALFYLAKSLVDATSAALLVLAYIFCGAVAGTLQFEIHQECFYPLAIALLLSGLYGSNFLLWVGTALSLSVKEDAGVYLFPVFLFLAWYFPKKRWQCLALSFLSLIYSGLALKLWMPLHQPAANMAPYYLPMWARYGKNFHEVALQMLTHPWWVVQDIVGNSGLYKNLLSWAFLPLLSPMGLLALPSLAVSSTALGAQRVLGLYYGVVLVPFFFFATAHRLARFPHAKRFALLVFCLSAFVGGSYLHVHKAKPFYGEMQSIEPELRKNFPGLEKVYVQSGLLPYLPYEMLWQRLEWVPSDCAAKNCAILLFSALSTDPMTSQQIHADLLQQKYFIVLGAGHWALYQKKEEKQ